MNDGKKNHLSLDGGSVSLNLVDLVLPMNRCKTCKSSLAED